MGKNEKKVLIVEDDGFISEVYSVKLEAEEFSVVVAADGKTALNLVEKENPDLIILDLFIPKVSGIDFLRTIRSKDRSVDTPVIVLTNSDEKENFSKVTELGVSDYLIKSQYTPDEIILKIKEFLK